MSDPLARELERIAPPFTVDQVKAFLEDPTSTGDDELHRLAAIPEFSFKEYLAAVALLEDWNTPPQADLAPDNWEPDEFTHGSVLKLMIVEQADLHFSLDESSSDSFTSDATQFMDGGRRLAQELQRIHSLAGALRVDLMDVVNAMAERREVSRNWRTGERLHYVSCPNCNAVAQQDHASWRNGGDCSRCEWLAQQP